MTHCACSHEVHEGRPCKPSCNCQESRPVPHVTPPTLAAGPETEEWDMSIGAFIEGFSVDGEAG